MLTLTVTQFDQQSIDMIRYTSILCGYCKVTVDDDQIIVNIDTDLCLIDELSQGHKIARKLQEYGSVRMEREYPRVDRL